MWAAKLPGEGACLWDACKAMCEVMSQLGVAIDGGKDSLSMAARVGKETVKAPGSLSLRVRISVPQSDSVVNMASPISSGTLVISAYAVCPDITATVTPDLEDPDGKGISQARTSASVITAVIPWKNNGRQSHFDTSGKR